MFISIKLLQIFNKLSPLLRRLILVVIDELAIIGSLFITIWFIPSINENILENSYIWIFPFSLTTSFLINYFSGQYKSLTRHVGSKMIYQIALRNLLLITLIFSISKFFNLPSFDTKYLMIFWLLTTTIIGFKKFLIRDLLIYFFKKNNSTNNPCVVIYGAGAAGVQLANSLKSNRDYKLLFFVDDNKNLWHREINGVSILSPNNLRKKRKDIDQVFLAIPSLLKSRRLEIINQINHESIQVKSIPSLEELITGKATINTLRSIELDELLGREAVPPDKNLLGKSLNSKNICITGAGGSIGSELTRQIIKLNPKKLILIDQNELSLYNLTKELNCINTKGIPIKSCLGDVKEDFYLSKLFKKESVEIVFHAAAYKHVPIVESNPIFGLFNNIVATRVVAKVAKECSLSHFVLISSDKAVRPTNLMGCSKRVSELITQSYSTLNSRTKYSMVRFGNVIGSSGSVVPLFMEQISKGGPITLTHKEVTRYLMSIVEACQLVLQVIELSKGGELFLLDMGEPVKILDLAKKMINLSGLKVKDKQNPNGDIHIITTGLRPGEKLYEELLIDAEALPTSHPLIYKAIDDSIPGKNFLNQLDKLEISLKNQDLKISLEILKKIVPEWEKN